MLAIFKKELRTYFTTVTGYVFLGFFVLITAYFFVSQNLVAQSGNYNEALSGSLIMFLILIPMLTMRSFAEEARQKTDQLLYSSPVSVTSVVIGKFLAAICLFLIGMAITALFPILLAHYSEGMDIGLTVVGMLGFFLMACSLIAVGIFVSVLTDNQLVAGAATFALVFMLLMMDNISSSAPIGNTAGLVFVLVLLLAVGMYLYVSAHSLSAALVFSLAGIGVALMLFFISRNIYDGAIAKVLDYFSVLRRYENFYLGVVNISDVVYYITFPFIFLYLTVGTIEKRRWS